MTGRATVVTIYRPRHQLWCLGIGFDTFLTYLGGDAEAPTEAADQALKDAGIHRTSTYGDPTPNTATGAGSPPTPTTNAHTTTSGDHMTIAPGTRVQLPDSLGGGNGVADDDYAGHHWVQIDDGPRICVPAHLLKPVLPTEPPVGSLAAVWAPPGMAGPDGPRSWRQVWERHPAGWAAAGADLRKGHITWNDLHRLGQVRTLAEQPERPTLPRRVTSIGGTGITVNAPDCDEVIPFDVGGGGVLLAKTTAVELAHALLAAATHDDT